MEATGTYTAWHLINGYYTGRTTSEVIVRMSRELEKEWLKQECNIMDSRDYYEILARLEDRNLMPLFNEEGSLVGWDDVKYDLSDFINRKEYLGFHLLHDFDEPEPVAGMVRVTRDYLYDKMEQYEESFLSAAKAVLSHALKESVIIAPPDMPEEELLSFDNLTSWMEETIMLSEVSLEVNLNMSEADRPVFADDGTIVPEGVKELFSKSQEMPQEPEQAGEEKYPAVYRKSLNYAINHGEVDKYHESRKLDRECKGAIEETIRQNFDGMYLKHDIVKPLAEQYGSERIAFVLANTLQEESWDGRFSRNNKAWASEFSIPENIVRGMDMNSELIVNSHPAVLDGFIDMFRSEVLEQEKELSTGQEKVTSGHDVQKSETEQPEPEQTEAEKAEPKTEQSEPEKSAETPEFEDYEGALLPEEPDR